jgi:uncharacterized protein with PQ loop repeat
MENRHLVIGVFLGICAAISLVPHLITLIKEKKTAGISIYMLAMSLAGLGGWIWIGILNNNSSLIIAHSFSFIVNLLIIFFYMTYRNRNLR